MSKKSWEAIVIGVGLWLVGVALVIALGDLSLFPALAPVAMVGLIPVMYLLTRFHLRDVAPPTRLESAVRLSLLATVVQFPLDALAFLSMYKLDWPQLTDSAQESIVFALMAGYFFLLVVPWSVGAREQAAGEAV